MSALTAILAQRIISSLMAADAARRIDRNSPEAEALFASAPPGVRAEILRGTVCMSPAPAPRHQRINGRLYRRLSVYDQFDGGPSDPRGWVFVLEPELHLGARPDKLRPDIAAWRVERATFSVMDAAINVTPDWVCEVLSPSTETIDRGTKAPIYAEHGVEWLWLIDPEEDRVEVFRNERAVFRPSNERAPFDALALQGLFER